MLDEIPNGSAVYLDANIFIYDFTEKSRQCQSFINRCQRLDVHGVTGSHMVLEVAHRLMMLEAVERGLVSGRNIPARLKRNPELVGTLVAPRRWLEWISDANIVVLEMRRSTIEASLHWQRQYGLLVNDSVSAALMNEHGVMTIATNDRDFIRVPAFSVYAPADI